jgi:hypothetical protein
MTITLAGEGGGGGVYPASLKKLQVGLFYFLFSLAYIPNLLYLECMFTQCSSNIVDYSHCNMKDK